MTKYDNSAEAIDETKIVLRAAMQKHSLAYVLEILSALCEEQSNMNEGDDKWLNDADRLSTAAAHVWN